MIIWTDAEGRITTISYTPRDTGTVGGYDVEEIPEAPEGKETRFNPQTQQFYFYPEDTIDDVPSIERLQHLEEVVDIMLGGEEDE